MRNTAGSRTIARPSATRCRWPPESCFGLRFSSSSSWRISAARRTRSSISWRGSRWLRRREGEVVEYGHVRVERVRLEDHRDVAGGRREVVHDVVADQDASLGDALEPREHAQDGALPAAGRADEHHELAVLDVERELANGQRVVVPLPDVLERDSGHRLTPPRGGRATSVKRAAARAEYAMVMVRSGSTASTRPTTLTTSRASASPSTASGLREERDRGLGRDVARAVCRGPVPRAARAGAGRARKIAPR